MTLAQLFGSTKVTAGKHKLKVSFSSDASVRSNACELDLTIDPAPLTPSITGTASKTYDGTTNVASGQLSITLTGVLDGDTVTAAATSYAYDNAIAGENKTITASGITLEGASKDNYTLSSTTATTTGTITKATVSITWGNTTQTVTYSGTQATITVPTVIAENGVTVNVTPEYSYAAQGGATFTPGLPTSAGTYTVRASIVESGNLTAAQADMTLTINKAPLTITGATAASKPYDGNTTATVEAVTFDGLKNGETLALGADYTATGTFTDANAGENKSVTVTVTLADTEKANNYQLSDSTCTATGTITKADPVVTDVSVSTPATIYESASLDSINGLDYWDNPDGWEPAGDDSWLSPTDEGLADSQWNCGDGWYMELGKGNCDPDYAGTADLYHQFEDEQEYQPFYSGVWRMEGDCLRLELSAGVGTSASGSFPVLIDPSGDHLHIQQSRDGYTCPPFFDDDVTFMELTRSYG